MGLKLNLGCGWPWPDNAADEVLLSHVLEHLGATPQVEQTVLDEPYASELREGKIDEASEIHITLRAVK
jgi:hypothetical protein